MTSRPGDELLHLLRSKRPDGTDAFTSADVEGFIVWSLLVSGALAQAPDPAVSQFMGAFALALGLGPSSKPAEVEAALKRHFDAHPVHPTLMQEVDRLALAATSAEGDDRKRAAARFVGEVATTLVTSPAPDGSVRGGPFARFKLNDKSGK